MLDASRALNLGLTHDEIKNVLQVVTIIFKSSAAALAFYKMLREWARTRKGAVGVSDIASGKILSRIEAKTEDTTLTSMVRHDSDSSV